MNAVRITGLLLLASAARLLAPPPMITGDVPTADKGRFELYAGLRYQENEAGEPGRQLPFTELVYGISDRQELTFEIAYEPATRAWLRRRRCWHQVSVPQRNGNPYLASPAPPNSNFPPAANARGLGTGEFDYDIRLRAQKT